jgi:hypothetical protein
MSYSDKLRRFADYLDGHPRIAGMVGDAYDYPTLHLYAEDWQHFQTLIAHMGGYVKSGYGGSLTAQHREQDDDGGRTFAVYISVSGVCERREKLDDDGNVVTRTIPAQEASTVVEYEYECPDHWTER